MTRASSRGGACCPCSGSRCWFFPRRRPGVSDGALVSRQQRAIRDLARDFAQKEIAPIAAKIDETGEFPIATVKKMGELGLMGIEMPPEYGGGGLDCISYVLAMEGRADIPVAAKRLILRDNLRRLVERKGTRGGR